MRMYEYIFRLLWYIMFTVCIYIHCVWIYGFFTLLLIYLHIHPLIYIIHVYYRYFDISAAKKDLKYVPLKTFKEGWIETINWFKIHWLPKYKASLNNGGEDKEKGHWWVYEYVVGYIGVCIVYSIVLVYSLYNIESCWIYNKKM